MEQPASKSVCGVCASSMDDLVSKKPLGSGDTELLVVVGHSSSTNLPPRDGRVAPIVRELRDKGAGLPDSAAPSLDEVTEAIMHHRPSVGALCGWSAELNTVFHMKGLDGVAKVTLVSTRQDGRVRGSEKNAEAIGRVLEAALHAEVAHKRLLCELSTDAVDGLHGHQQAFARQLYSAMVAAHVGGRNFTVVASGGLKIQSMACGAFAYAMGIETVYMHERFEHQAVTFSPLRGIFREYGDRTDPAVAMLRAGTPPYADVPRTSPSSTTSPESAAGGPHDSPAVAEMRHKIARRGWSSRIDSFTPDPIPEACRVEVVMTGEAVCLVVQTRELGLRVTPTPDAWLADPVGLQQELTGLVLQELGR